MLPCAGVWLLMLPDWLAVPDWPASEPTAEGVLLADGEVSVPAVALAWPLTPPDWLAAPLAEGVVSAAVLLGSVLCAPVVALGLTVVVVLVVALPT